MILKNLFRDIFESPLPASTRSILIRVTAACKKVPFTCLRVSRERSSVHRLARDIKRIRADLVLVCGGPHPSLAPEHTLSTGDIDFAIVGEGEVPCCRLVKHLLGGGDKAGVEIPGVCRMAGGQVLGRREPELLDLSSLPVPDLGLLPVDRYFAVKPRVYVHTSRGCAFNCIYCSVPGMCNHKVREIPLALGCSFRCVFSVLTTGAQDAIVWHVRNMSGFAGC